MTSAQDLDPHLIQKETNAEVRREIVRKIGVERVCQKLGAKILDKHGNYELLNLNLGDNRAHKNRLTFCQKKCIFFLTTERWYKWHKPLII